MHKEDYRSLVAKVAVMNRMLSFQAEEAGLDRFLPLLERMRAEGAVLFMKLDGGRRGRPYTAWVSGRVLKGEFFRTDSGSMEDALAYIIVHYARSQWGFAE